MPLRLFARLAVALLAASLAACSFSNGASPTDGGRDSTTSTEVPTVPSTQPADGTAGVSVVGPLSATFSEAMDPSSLTATTFTLTVGSSALAVEGTVTYASSTAVFRPTTALARDSDFTATVTTGARSSSGVPLAAAHTWSFRTGSAVELRSAGAYAVLAWRAISGTGAMVTGDVGISPSLSNSISGFALSAPATDYSTSAQVVGKVYARDYMEPTPTILATAVADFQLAITDASERRPTVTGVGGELGGMTLAPGIYNWQRAAITTDVTLAGGPTDVWVFQIAETLGVAASTRVVLSGGAQAKNVFWQVTGAVTIGAAAQFNGIVLASSAFSSGAASVITGRLLSQAAITITDSTIIEP